MIIRTATPSDIPSIVSLLKLSLGESLLPKSEAYWKWKHIDNPFGVSPILLAEENGELAGVRAFMRWGWTDGEQQFRAVRAVDTATHPDHQGKGIFRKLTLQLVEECRRDGVSFIFNTPNSKSKPGYLKMGWVEAGKVSIRLSPVNIAKIAKNVLLSGARSPAPEDQSMEFEDSEIRHLLERDRRFRAGIGTDVNVAYLDWRYRQVPGIKYLFFTFREAELTTLIIGRIKSSKLGNEFRVTDCFSAERAISRKCRREFRKFAKRRGGDFITASDQVGERLLMGLNFRVGPSTTVNLLDFPHPEKLLSFGNWNPSLGDLELF